MRTSSVTATITWNTGSSAGGEIGADYSYQYINPAGDTTSSAWMTSHKFDAEL